MIAAASAASEPRIQVRREARGSRLEDFEEGDTMR